MTFALGALPTPPDKLALAWPVRLALAEQPTVAPLKFHSPKCDPKITTDQNPFGACVMFSGAYVQADQELTDEGRQLLPGVIDPLRTYAAVKGLPWPLVDSGQDPNPGLNPPDLWNFIQSHGWYTKDGSAPRKCGPYYSLGQPNGSAAFLDAFQQTLLQLGPSQFTAGWPDNWWSTNARGFMPTPGPQNGGHAFEGCGYEEFPNGCPVLSGCTYDTIHHQTWGAFGHDPDYPNHFRIHSPWWGFLGWEAWRVFDITGDGPTPTPPPPPPGGPTMNVFDKTAKLVDVAVGKWFYKTDGRTQLVPLSSAGTGIYSPFATTASQRCVWISTGGQLQEAVVNLADCTNIRDFTPGPAPAPRPHPIAVTVDGLVKAAGTIVF